MNVKRLLISVGISFTVLTTLLLIGSFVTFYTHDPEDDIGGQGEAPLMLAFPCAIVSAIAFTSSRYFRGNGKGFPVLPAGQQDDGSPPVC